MATKKKSAQKISAPILTTDELPEWAKGHEGEGMENISTRSLGWMGDDCQLDVDDLLSEKGFEPESPLELILLGIIVAHPVDNGLDRQERLETALNALTGKERKRGMDDVDDYDLLMDVAGRYFEEYLENNDHPPKGRLTAIIR